MKLAASPNRSRTTRHIELVKMLPVLLFESLWKVLWLGLVALPNAAAGTLDPAITEVLVNCSLIVVIAAVTPWGYVWSQLAQATGDRWR